MTSPPTNLGTRGAFPPAPVRAPLIGRSTELKLLDDALARAITTRIPQTVTLIGAGGIGKSRLLYEFLQRVRERERRVRSFRGLCRENDTAFGPIQRMLSTRFELSDSIDPELAREKFRQVVAAALGDRRVTEFLHFMGAFLGLRFPESPFIKAVEEDPVQFSQIGRVILRRFLEIDAQKSPLILTFEDLHWATPDLIDLVQYMVAQMHDAPVLMLCAARPELVARRPDWFEAGDRHLRLDLAALDAESAEKLVQQLLAPTDHPPPELVEAAVEMGGGSPYLLEQTVRTFLSSGTLFTKHDGKWGVDLSRLETARLPLTVEDAVSARIAALTPSERSLLEMAATMGGIFWLGALVSLGRIGRPTPSLWGGAEDLAGHYRDLLTGLAERDYLLQLPDSLIAGETEFAFKHNLERETIHRLTNPSKLNQYHLVVAEWLEFRFAERAEEHCEILAQHFEQGSALRKAAHYYLMAGDRARARYANQKASEYYKKGLELLGDEDVNLRIDALHHYGDVLQLAGDNEEALAAFRKMLELSFRLDLKAKGGAAHNRIGRLYRAVGQLDEAMRHLGTGHALFDAEHDQRGVASSLDDVGKVHWMRGVYDSAERFIREGLELRQALADQRSIALSYNNLGLVYQDSGRFEEALAAFEEALVLRREIGDLPGIAQTLNNLGTMHQDNGNDERANELWTEALEVAKEVGDKMRQAVIYTNLGESNYRLRRSADAIRLLKLAEETAATLGDRILEAEILRGLAKAHMLTADYAAARSYIGRSVALFDQSRSKPFLGVALRSLGEILSEAGEHEEDRRRARESFERSIRIFEELSNEVELARSYQSYADFLGTSDTTAAEAKRLRSRADEIQKRVRSIEPELLPLEGEQTQPDSVQPVDAL